MSLRLRNENDPAKTLCLNRTAWFQILEMAEQFRWIPYGTVDNRLLFDMDLSPAGYDPYETVGGNGNGHQHSAAVTRKVLLDDALNLADALERAFLEYEPQPSIARAYITTSGRYVPVDNHRPGIGTIAAVVDFCRQGAFLIEGYS